MDPLRWHHLGVDLETQSLRPALDSLKASLHCNKVPKRYVCVH